MQHTTNYDLPQWEDTDVVTREDVNGALSAIDTAMSKFGNCRIQLNVYIGDGKGGDIAPMQMFFRGRPLLVIIVPATSPQNKQHFFMATNGVTEVYTVENTPASRTTITWLDRGIRIYNADAAYQMDALNVFHYVIALVAADA